MAAAAEADSVTTTTGQRWIAPVALLVAVVAVALAAWALARPSQPSPQQAAQPTAQPTKDDSKGAVCGAFDTVSQAVGVQTHLDLGPEPLPQAAVAGNARLALVGGGQYLVNAVGPGTPQELADAVRAFGNSLTTVGINALAGTPNSDPAQTERLKQAEAHRSTVAGLCA
ncbi:hypothetical protein BOO86_28640 [Mycobacterium sp. CBMA 234]|uniref:hypothetical protein n=1 Tax=Mycolicibacterium sp. CBMA 234 TaxID=1918495 RepID=UPI0012DE57F9|nr:hypothetical protein [Mycolicibacterium sp. CBMA 234]MUL68469.1 hypothetical protein [Mycolicibacterium sp. CBMA 234]